MEELSASVGADGGHGWSWVVILCVCVCVYLCEERLELCVTDQLRHRGGFHCFITTLFTLKSRLWSFVLCFVAQCPDVRECFVVRWKTECSPLKRESGAQPAVTGRVWLCLTNATHYQNIPACNMETDFFAQYSPCGSYVYIKGGSLEQKMWWIVKWIWAKVHLLRHYAGQTFYFLQHQHNVDSLKALGRKMKLPSMLLRCA